MPSPWPGIPYDGWRETCFALHMYTQVIGKYRLAHTPWENHSWHATLYLNGRGFTTSLVPDGPGGVEIMLDLIDHAVVGAATDGRTARFQLAPMSAAGFHARFVRLIRELGGTPEFHGRPNEVPDPTSFTEDHAERPYDAEAVTRFSGRPAPLHPGDIPALPDDVTRETYSHEVSSAGFWPGGRQCRFSGLLLLCLSGPARLRRGARGSRGGPDGVSREHLSGCRRSRRVEP